MGIVDDLSNYFRGGGSYHCLFCCWTLVHSNDKLHFFFNSEIIRTRDTAVLDTLDILVDVGATYEPEK